MVDRIPEMERSSVTPASVVRALGRDELAVLGTLFERLFPADELGPGALEIGVLEYVQRALSGPYASLVPVYRAGLGALGRAALAKHGREFTDLVPEKQDALIELLEQDAIPGAEGLFKTLWQHLREGLFCDPIHGGNQGMMGWRLIGFPGAQYGYSAEEQRLDVVIRREPLSVADLPRGNGEGGPGDAR